MKNDHTAVFKDFAHSPSKLEATINAVKEQFPERSLVACMELHTYSSLSKEFLSHYHRTMDKADYAIIYFNPHAIQIKKLPLISEKDIADGFNNQNLEIFNDSKLLTNRLISENWENKNLLMMSSGDFDNLDLALLAGEITKRKV